MRVVSLLLLGIGELKLQIIIMFSKKPCDPLIYVDENDMISIES